jgi:hypothetical protein
MCEAGSKGALFRNRGKEVAVCRPYRDLLVEGNGYPQLKLWAIAGRPCRDLGRRKQEQEQGRKNKSGSKSKSKNKSGARTRCRGMGGEK